MEQRHVMSVVKPQVDKTRVWKTPPACNIAPTSQLQYILHLGCTFHAKAQVQYYIARVWDLYDRQRSWDVGWKSYETLLESAS